MHIETSQQTENRRIAQRNEAQKSTWEYLRTNSMVEAVRFARDHGWKIGTVQVRFYQLTLNDFEYLVEPNEHCGCPNLLRYEDFFD